MTGLIRHIDHVLVRADGVVDLWGVFTRDLQLPIAWPPFEYQEFLSAAFSVGATNVELLEPLSADVPDGTFAPGGRPIGVAFEPYTVEEAVAGLDALELAHAAPWEYRLSEAISWRSLPLAALPGCPIALFVKYSTDRDTYREAMAHQLAATGGWPLGVSGFHGISFQATDTGPWERLLGGRGLSWEVDGSLLEVEDSRPAVSLRVSSLAAATEALKQRGMLAEPDGAVEVAYRGVPTGIVLRQG